MESKAIVDFLMGDEIIGFYYLTRADLKSRRDKQGHYLAVDLSDASGQIPGHVWEDADTVANEVTTGDVVKVRGSVQSYQGRKQIAISRMRKVNEADNVDMSRLVASVGRKADNLWREYTKLATSVVNPFLRSLLRKFTEDEEFRVNFCKSPGSKGHHHSYLGGLLEHTVSVAKICERISGLYSDTDSDLLLAVALLYDIGKIETYEQGPTFDYTDKGRLLGSTAIGIEMLQKKIQEISAFPGDLAMQVQHIILSHKEHDENTPAVVPMTAEAIILHFADQLDCVQNLFVRSKKRDHKDDVEWSQYIKSLGRHFYFGKK
ncbi:MAG: 3'-5' exoribonuclease YhaM family protein [bacterium]